MGSRVAGVDVDLVDIDSVPHALFRALHERRRRLAFIVLQHPAVINRFRNRVSVSISGLGTDLADSGDHHDQCNLARDRSLDPVAQRSADSRARTASAAASAHSDCCGHRGARCHLGHPTSVRMAKNDEDGGVENFALAALVVDDGSLSTAGESWRESSVGDRSFALAAISPGVLARPVTDRGRRLLFAAQRGGRPFGR